MATPRRYHRPTKQVAASEHLVAFLDILGFRQLLNDGELDRVFLLFEEIADTIYQSLRINYLWGFTPIQPVLTNFSDSIILHGELDADDSEQVQQLKHQLFFDQCRGIIATCMRLRVPIRGGISIGPLFSNVAESVVPDNVTRFGAGAVLPELVEKHGSEAIRPQDFEHYVIPPVRFSVNMGTALTEAYELESSINSIGCFLTDKFTDLPIIDFLKMTDCVATHNVDGRSLLAVNWCNYWDYDTFKEILDYAEMQVNHPVPRVAAKWESLVDFARNAPVR